MFYKSELETDMEAVLDKVCARFEFPIFVKPANTGSSVGVSKAYDREELKTALIKAAQFDVKILAEEFIDGREIELAVLETVNNGARELIVSRCGEVKPGSDFYDYDDKYKNGTSQLFIPARLPEKTIEEIRRIAVRAYRMLGCRGLSRVDFFVREKDGSILLNEINTLPGFTAISMYPKLWAHAGVEGSELLDRLIAYALAV